MDRLGFAIRATRRTLKLLFTHARERANARGRYTERGARGLTETHRYHETPVNLVRVMPSQIPRSLERRVPMHSRIKRHSYRTYETRRFNLGYRHTSRINGYRKKKCYWHTCRRSFAQPNSREPSVTGGQIFLYFFSSQFHLADR